VPARLEEAVAAFRSALEERTRARVPLDWAALVGGLRIAFDLLQEGLLSIIRKSGKRFSERSYFRAIKTQ
jgi:hypothetical protein